MRRVLIITHYFPPAGGSGTHRPAAWARHLHEFGYEPVVLTPSPAWHAGATEPTDLGGDHVQVHRTPMDGTARLSERLRRLLPVDPNAVARVLDLKGLWAHCAAREGARLLRGGGFSALLTTSPPYALAVTGAWLARRFGVPWIMDLRSPWAAALAMPWLGYAGYVADRAVQAACCRAATAVTTHDRGGRDRLLRQVPELRGKPVRCIPNGFDRGSVVGQSSSGGPMRLAHVGVFYWNARRQSARRGLRSRLAALAQYRPDDVDLSVQSAGFLLRAVRRALDGRPEMAERLRVALVGQLDPSDRGLASALGLGGVVHATGPLPHAEAAAHLRQADALYLPFWWSRRAGRVVRAPSKLFEYIGTRKPVLAVVGPGDTRDMLERAGTGVFCDEPTEEALATALTDLWTDWDHGRLSGPGSRPAEADAYARGFEWRSLVGRMARVLDEAVARAARGRDGGG